MNVTPWRHRQAAIIERVEAEVCEALTGLPPDLPVDTAEFVEQAKERYREGSTLLARAMMSLPRETIDGVPMEGWRPVVAEDVAVEGDRFRDKSGGTVTLRGAHAVDGWNEGPFHAGAFDILAKKEDA